MNYFYHKISALSIQLRPIRIGAGTKKSVIFISFFCFSCYDKITMYWLNETVDKGVIQVIFGVQIPPVRLALAIACTALALILLLVVLIRGLYHRIRFGHRYGDRRSIRRKRGGSVGGGVLSHHSRPSSSSRRYGKGYQPYLTHKRRRRIRRKKYGQFQYHGYTSPAEVGGHSHREKE